MKTKLFIPCCLILSLTAQLTTASESLQRPANLKEFQEALGLTVITSEIQLDRPLFGRLVLVAQEGDAISEKVLRDFHFPATYIQFLNIIDSREARVKPLAYSQYSISMTSWNGEKRKTPQGWSYAFDNLQSAVKGSSGGSVSFIRDNPDLDTNSDILVWQQTVTSEKAGNTLSQSLVLRLNDSPWQSES